MGFAILYARQKKEQDERAAAARRRRIDAEAQRTAFLNTVAGQAAAAAEADRVRTVDEYIRAQRAARVSAQ